MRKIVLGIVLGLSSIGYAQSTSFDYDEIGMLASGNSSKGTARFDAMAGAFGALGSDVSSVNINPAGGVVSLHSLLSISIDYTTNKSTGYFSGKQFGNVKGVDNDYNITNVSGALIFKKHESNWNRSALNFNYQENNNFDKNFSIKAKGENLNKGYFDSSPAETDIYTIFKEKRYRKYYNGTSSVLNITYSSTYQNNLHLGGGINFYSFELNEVSELTEQNRHTDGYYLNAFNKQEIDHIADGLSISLGTIYKINKSFRIGLALETPTLYSEFNEEFNTIKQKDINNNNTFSEFNKYLGYTKIETRDENNEKPKTFETKNEFSNFTYQLTTPARITTSFAYIFENNGLISCDYTYKDFSTMKLRGGEDNFMNENDKIAQHYESSHKINIGTEWRYENMSFRAGYSLKTNPNTLHNDNVGQRTASLGFGINLNGNIFDISIAKLRYSDFYHVNKQNDVQASNNTFTTKLTYSF